MQGTLCGSLDRRLVRCFKSMNLLLKWFRTHLFVVVSKVKLSAFSALQSFVVCLLGNPQILVRPPVVRIRVVTVDSVSSATNLVSSKHELLVGGLVLKRLLGKQVFV